MCSASTAGGAAVAVGTGAPTYAVPPEDPPPPADAIAPQPVRAASASRASRPPFTANLRRGSSIAGASVSGPRRRAHGDSRRGGTGSGAAGDPPNAGRRHPPVVSRKPSSPAGDSSGGAFHFSARLPSQGATMTEEKVRPGSGGTGPAARHRPSPSTIV